MTEPRNKEGDRVRLLLPMDAEDEGYIEDVQPGDEGTVTHVDAFGSVHVEWDNGAEFAVFPDEDVWITL